MLVIASTTILTALPMIRGRLRAESSLPALVVGDMDGLTGTLDEDGVDMDELTATLNEAGVDTDRLTALLDEAGVDTDGPAATLDEAVAGTDGLTATLDEAVADTDGLTATLNEAVVDIKLLAEAGSGMGRAVLTLPSTAIVELMEVGIGIELIERTTIRVLSPFVMEEAVGIGVTIRTAVIGAIVLRLGDTELVSVNTILGLTLSVTIENTAVAENAIVSVSMLVAMSEEVEEIVESPKL